MRRRTIETGEPWRVEVIDDAAALSRIAPAWQALWQAAAPLRPSPALRHAYVELGVRHRAAEHGLRIILVWQGERLVLAWPLTVQRARGVRIARHIGSGSNEEYAGPLVAAAVDTGSVVAAAVALLRRHADALWAYNLASGSAVADAIARAGLGSSVEAVQSPIIRCGGAASHADWLKTRSRNFRNAMGSARRQLAATGTLESRLVPETEAVSFTSWLFATKRQWGAARGKSAAWLHDQRAEAFFAAALADRVATGAFGLAICLDGRYVAGALCFDGQPIEFYVTVFDDRLARFSPGSLIYEDVVRHAIAHGCDVDLRITWDDYKRRWADGSDPRATMLIALTVRGLPTLWRQRLVLRIKAFRRRAGALRRRLRA